MRGLRNMSVTGAPGGWAPRALPFRLLLALAAGWGARAWESFEGPRVDEAGPQVQMGPVHEKSEPGRAPWPPAIRLQASCYLCPGVSATRSPRPSRTPRSPKGICCAVATAYGHPDPFLGADFKEELPLTPLPMQPQTPHVWLCLSPPGDGKGHMEGSLRPS